MWTLLQSLLPRSPDNRSHSRFSPPPETVKTMISGVLLDFRKQFLKVCNGVNKHHGHWLLFDSLAVVVEDSSSSCCVTVKVFPHMTTAALKQQVGL